MKKFILSTIIVLCVSLFANTSFSQTILFTEDWSSGSFATNGWSFPSGQGNWGFSSSSTMIPSCSTFPAAIFSGSPTLTSYSNELMSPMINATAYGSFNLFLSFKLKLNNINTTTFEAFAVEYKTSSSSSWFTLVNYDNSGGSFEVSPKQVLLPGMAGTNFQIRFRAYGPNSSNYNEWILDDIELSGAQPCIATPNPGNTMGCATSLCPGQCTELYTQNYLTYGTGTLYNWQLSNISPTGPWINIVGAYSLIYHACPGPGTTTYYRCVVTCSASGASAPSIPIGVTVAPWTPTSSCYCTSSALAFQDEEIYNVTMNGSSTNPLYSYSNGCTTVAPGPGSVLNQYSSFLTLPPLTNLTPGLAIPFTIEQDECDGAPYFANRIGIWIDFNHNTSFADPGELVFAESINSIGPKAVTGVFTVPMSAFTGNTIMRIVCADSTSILSPCGTYAFGETEDYLVNISSSPFCTGTPNPGNTLSSIASPSCGTPFTLSLQNTFTASGITYQWFNTSGAISGATNPSYTTSLTTSDIFYCDVTCIFSSSIGTSTPIAIIMTGANSGSSNESACASFVWNGNTYTLSGTYSGTFTNSSGCDSVHTLQLSINNSPTTYISQTTCDSLYWPLNSTLYTTSGIYTASFLNSAGCDSLYVLNATINYSTNDTSNTVVCDSIMLGGVTYTTSGTYTATFTNALGCDSTITLNTTIDSSSNLTINQTGCDSVTYNGQTYTLSGTYTGTYTTASGCDSIITLNILLNYINLLTSVHGDTVICNAPGLTYQWLDCTSNAIISGATDQYYLPVVNGNYAVIVSGGAGCFDTSACTYITLVGVDNYQQAIHETIYPNPNNGLFSISLNSDATLTLTNTLSEIIFKQQFKQGKQTIDIRDKAPGVYLLKISHQHGDEIIKIKIER